MMNNNDKNYKEIAIKLFKLIPEEIKNNGDFIKNNLETCGEFYDTFGNLNDDVEFIVKAVKYNSKFIKHISEKNITKNFVINALTNNRTLSLSTFPKYTGDLDVIMSVFSSSPIRYNEIQYIDKDELNAKQILTIIKKIKSFPQKLVPNNYTTLLEIIDLDYKCPKNILLNNSEDYELICKLYPQFSKDILLLYPKFLYIIPDIMLLTDDMFYKALLIDHKYMLKMYGQFVYHKKDKNNFKINIPRDIAIKLLKKDAYLIREGLSNLSDYHKDFEIMSTIVIPKYPNIIYYLNRSFPKKEYDKLFEIALEYGYDTSTRHNDLCIFD
jgi:hypothetical protein